MKNKSYNSGGPWKIANDPNRLFFGDILAESYWKKDKDGNIKQSEPVTSEILDQWLYPLKYYLDGFKVFLDGYYLGLFIDVFTTPDGVTTERIVFKPDETCPDGATLKKLMECNFARHYLNNAND